MFSDCKICLLTIQRASGSQTIFNTPLEYRFFLKLMKRYKRIHQVRVFAFCLLPSAVYIVAGGEDARAVFDYFADINRSFCEFLSVLSQTKPLPHIGRSKVIVIEDDRTLMDLAAFVEAFPVRRGLAGRPQDYEWGSFRLRAFGIENGLVEQLNICP